MAISIRALARSASYIFSIDEYFRMNENGQVKKDDVKESFIEEEWIWLIEPTC